MLIVTTFCSILELNVRLGIEGAIFARYAFGQNIFTRVHRLKKLTARLVLLVGRGKACGHGSMENVAVTVAAFVENVVEGNTAGFGLCKMHTSKLNAGSLPFCMHEKKKGQH